MSKKRLQRAKTISFRARQTYITPEYFFGGGVGYRPRVRYT